MKGRGRDEKDGAKGRGRKRKGIDGKGKERKGRKGGWKEKVLTVMTIYYFRPCALV